MFVNTDLCSAFMQHMDACHLDCCCEHADSKTMCRWTMKRLSQRLRNIGAKLSRSALQHGVLSCLNSTAANLCVFSCLCLLRIHMLNHRLLGKEANRWIGCTRHLQMALWRLSKSYR